MVDSDNQASFVLFNRGQETVCIRDSPESEFVSKIENTEDVQLGDTPVRVLTLNQPEKNTLPNLLYYIPEGSRVISKETLPLLQGKNVVVNCENATDYIGRLELDPRSDNKVRMWCPFGDTYGASDGEHINVDVLNLLRGVQDNSDIAHLLQKIADLVASRRLPKKKSRGFGEIEIGVKGRSG